MEKGKRIQVINREIALPEAIIQHIQSFLNEKQSAQTSILSKSWHSAWLTRPKLVLDERDFQKAAHSFSDFATKTMERYEKSNLKIDNFKLHLDFRNGKNRSVANELIAKALRIGAFSLDLEFRLPNFLIVTHGAFVPYENVARISVDARRRLDGSVGRCFRHKPLKLSSDCELFDTVRDSSWIFSKAQKLLSDLLSYDCGCLVEVKKTEVKTLATRHQNRSECSIL